ncbi:MAG: hypothetical protein IJK14_00095 [Clostridia bacterium]|nr:hypothetical protein [Clostridia bacterium]
MRWKLLEKISAGVLSVISGLAAIGVILAALHVIPADTASELTAIIFASDAGRWVAGCLGLLVLLAVAGLVVRAVQMNRLQARSAKIGSDESGSMFITVDALERMIRTVCKNEDAIKKCAVSVDPGEDGISATVRVSVPPETDLSVFAPSLMSKIRTAVSNVTGLRVMDVKLLIDQAKPAA